MISNAAAKYLWDVQQAAEGVRQFTNGRTLDDYLADGMLRAAVERQFQIIGEALARLRRVAPDVAALVPDLRQIIDFRNILVHAYDGVDALRVWGFLESHLPGLQREVADLLRDAPPLDEPL
jgi:uncharacterized protein with HEPN domain